MSSYKLEARKSTLSGAVLDSFSELQCLRDEAQEIVDNASEGLSQTQRVQTFEETASTLSGFCDDEPEIPDVIADLEVTYGESVKRSKRSGPSRVVRRDNAVSSLNAALECATNWIEQNEAHEKKDDVQELCDTIQQAIDEAESVEFPSMFG